MSHKTHERINDPMLKEDPAATEPRFEGLAINCLVVCVLYIFLVILILCINKNDGQLRYNLSIDQSFVACYQRSCSCK